jgi:hypothetical protein
MGDHTNNHEIPGVDHEIPGVDPETTGVDMDQDIPREEEFGLQDLPPEQYEEHLEQDKDARGASL